ncbi:MAG TPA: HAD family hydrolase [Verrucomicrobiae bacterium]|nr:HAD family hydrolase [Verrucomicrobiae bacterium]
MKPRAILLDLGGTVLDEGTDDYRAGAQSLAAELRSLGGLVPRDPGALCETFIRECDRVHETNVPDFTIADWMRRLAPGATGSELADLELALWRATTSMTPMPGVAAALDRIRDLGIPMAIVSNAVFSARMLEYELLRHRLSAHFRFVLSSADAGARKPDARIFRKALDRLRESPSGVWFAGDSWEKDIVGSSACGMSPIWISTAAPPAGGRVPHVRVASWGEFVNHLEGEVRG